VVPALWPAVPTLLLVVALVVAGPAGGGRWRGDEPLAVVLCGLCTAAVAPCSWSHHRMWVVPRARVLIGPGYDEGPAGWRGLRG